MGKAVLNLLKIASNQMDVVNNSSLPKEARKLLEIDFSEYTDDKEVLKILNEYELYKPEKMIEFLIGSFYGVFESIHSQIESIIELQISKEIGTLDGISDLVENVKYNPHDKEDVYKLVSFELHKGIGVLRCYIKKMVATIRSIDNQSSWEFFKKSKQNNIIINSNIKGIKLCIEAFCNATSTLLLIEKELGKDSRNIISKFIKFCNEELLNDDTCDLLNNYEFKELKNYKYFQELDKKLKNVVLINQSLNQYIEEYVDVLDDYNNIRF